MMLAMAHLLCKTEPFADLRFNLESECRIGREPDNDIALDNGTVSGYHCRITHTHGQWEVRDLGSTNGIAVNDQEKSQAFLVHGDALEVGSIQFQFVDESAVSTPAPAAPSPPPPAPVPPPPDQVEETAAPVEPAPAPPPVLSSPGPDDGNPWFLPVAAAGFILLGLGMLWYLKILWAS